ncbi:S-methyl-5-thioribose-1-phosphate isomerase [Streptomyces luteolus]|uniref:Multifunctional fusion protein n=1 Tax=Streptomyces luteolus TaxID=3043615 RepID=A0ABT6SRN3_9ACTN|nr:S-methyl-5-thioribose-1-phosphate isomerase [Streptomyces sp. B-S-A12]MDI3418025.1 S-methyl-5-thioribose-1-phosphate isomerase [Streptomyces sp. B-S-A12]
MERSITWDDGAIRTLDQRALPDEHRTLRLTTIDELIEAIATLAIRGAPAIGVAGALGVALAARLHTVDGRLDETAVLADAKRIATARPTAVNLTWAVERALFRLPQGADAVLDEALAMLDGDERTHRAASRRAADLLRQQCGKGPLRILTHCNTGRLATTAWGTALGTIRELAASGEVQEVIVGETRPLLQGARLTAWELVEDGIPHRLCVDSASAWAIASGLVDCVVVGADRITTRGDVANKIGTYALAVAAQRAGIPFVVVAPESTVDERLLDGSGIMIEERASDEVTHHGGRRMAPEATPVFNPAFDVTPSDLVTAVVTESRILVPGGDLADRIAACTRVVPDFPTAGVSFQDLGPVYADATLVRDTAAAMHRAFQGRFDSVLALEARGFPLGAVVAQRAGTPLVLARKPGKLPGTVDSVQYGLEYGSDRLETQSGALTPGAHVLVVDDVLATGGTLEAAARLVERSGARVSGLATVLELTALGGREKLAAHEVFAARHVT